MIRAVCGFILSVSASFNLLLAEGQTGEEAAVKEVLTQFTAAFNAGKVDQLGSFWEEDGEIVTPITGKAVDGREAITGFLKEQKAAIGDKKVIFTVNRVTFPEPDHAIVRGVVQFDDKGVLTDRKAREIELFKDDGKWYLDSLKEIDVEAPFSLVDHLKDLEWMIGTWEDTDDNIEILFETKWDTYKNFLTQKFSTAVLGLEELDGRQIIGWDSIQNKIRSWVFDSDGGFGEGVWKKEGDSWHVVLHYTLSDGRKASAVNIYTPVDAKSYTFSSTGRDVDGEILPNIDPVTVRRK